MGCCCGHCDYHHQGDWSPPSYPPAGCCSQEECYDQPGPRRRRRRGRGRGRGPGAFQDFVQEGSYDEPGRVRDPEELEDVLQGLQEEIERVRQDIAAVRESRNQGGS